MKKLIVLIAIATTFVSYSQDEDKGTIDTQRPTLTESYSIIKVNMLQFENGLDYSENSDSFSSGTFIRGSINNNIELRVFTDYKNINTLGAKFVIIDPNRSLLKIGTSFIYSTDWMGQSNDFRLAMTKKFKSIFTTYNFGYNGAIYNILLIGTPLGTKFSCFLEGYNDPIVNRIHGGFTWIIKRDIQLDINGGWKNTSKWYTGVGVSFRIR